VRQHIADYCAMISHLDEAIGRILDALDERGLTDNTIIVFAGDNGLAVGQHGLMGKQSLYDHSVRIPLLFAGPGVAKGETRQSLCYLHDVMPTLCDLLGLEVPESVQSRSLAPELGGDSSAGPDDLFLAYRHVMRGVTTGSHKLIEYHVTGRRRTQLFDLEADSWELNDLADDPSQGERISAMRQRLEEHRRTYADDQPGQGADFCGSD
jgi:arylsulfatase A-like enzyme